MKPNKYAIVLALAVGLPGAVLGGDPGADVRAVFAARCARCHGPDVSVPRAGFGYVLDLDRLRANPELVVPSRPDESTLWQMVHGGEMPPPNSPTGPLRASEKEVIRAWIAAGAPVESTSEPQANAPPAASAGRRTLVWLGKFHLVVVHFPIALLLAGLVGEAWSLWKQSRAPSPVVRFCLALGGLSAVATVGLGWLFALGHGSSGLLGLHRWIGTTAGVWAVAVAVCSERDSRRGVRSWWTRGLVLAGAALVGLTAHLGGLLVHGADFYDW
jgi:hypothetical protein